MEEMQPFLMFRKVESHTMNALEEDTDLFLSAITRRDFFTFNSGQMKWLAIYEGVEKIYFMNLKLEQTGIISKKHLHIKKNTTRVERNLGHDWKIRKGKWVLAHACSQWQDLYPEFQFLNSSIRCFN